MLLLPLWLDVQRFEAAPTNCFVPFDASFPSLVARVLSLVWTARATGRLEVRDVEKAKEMAFGCRGIIGRKTDWGADFGCGLSTMQRNMHALVPHPIWSPGAVRVPLATFCTRGVLALVLVSY